MSEQASSTQEGQSEKHKRMLKRIECSKKKKEFRQQSFFRKVAERKKITLINIEDNCCKGKWGVILEVKKLAGQNVVRIICSCDGTKTSSLERIQTEIDKIKRGIKSTQFNFDWKKTTKCERIDGWIVWKGKNPTMGKPVKIS